MPSLNDRYAQGTTPHDDDHVVDWFRGDYVNEPAVAGSHDKICLHLIDYTDGVEAYNWYNTKFHDKYEKLTQQMEQLPSSTDISSWTGEQNFKNNTSNPIPIVFQGYISVEVSSSATIGSEIGTDWCKVAAKIFTNTTVGEIITSQISVTQTIMVPAYRQITLKMAAGRTKYCGTCSQWDINGYIGDTEWQTEQGNPDASYYFYEQAL